ncbi:hypothetical protein SEPCBS119000_002715 [Sporothrix epigloea]|uniref:F-box domain-containing protein n=1 Tax=Sporothrix epigloea TaxID=1892477 RepID=A0ABP0DHM6_9PEZI
MASHDSWPLPGELVDAILELLEPCDLARVSQVCRALRLRAMDNHWWQKFIQRNLSPACSPLDATPLPAHLPTYRDLYVAHEPHWFLLRHKLWLSDFRMPGGIVLMRYNPQNGCIEGCQLQAVSRRSKRYSYPFDTSVDMRSFRPELSVRMDRPVIKLEARLPEVTSPTQDKLQETGPADGQGKGKGRARAPDEPPEAVTDPNASSLELRPQKRPKIHNSQPPGTSFSWLAYAQAINTDTPAIDPICPRIRPILMDIEDDETDTHRVRHQFIFARPLSIENAIRGGIFMSPTRQSLTTRRPSGPLPDDADDFAEDHLTLYGRSTISYPQYSVWPPPELPAPHRVRAKHISPHQYPRGPVGQPRLRSDVSERAFHVRKYLEAKPGAEQSAATTKARRPVQPVAPPSFAAEEDEDSSSETPASSRRDPILTYATLDPYYYTPTEDRPFRGIFVADYNSHGCEFLLVHQYDNVMQSGPPADENADGREDQRRRPGAPAAPVRIEGESDEAFAQRVRNARIYQGSIRAIKLTGDINVPRGEVTFMAPDLGAKGLYRVIPEDQPFAGTRIVEGRGHVSHEDFDDGRWVDTRILLISPDRLAVHWIDFGHISFLQRVDIDKCMNVLNRK